MRCQLMIAALVLVVLITGCAKEDVRCDFEEYRKSIDMDNMDMWYCDMEVEGVIYDEEKGECVEQAGSACKNHR